VLASQTAMHLTTSTIITRLLTDIMSANNIAAAEIL